MLLDPLLYHDCFNKLTDSDEPDYCLGLVPDFNTLATQSHTSSLPIFALPDEFLGGGTVLTQNQKKRTDFYDIYSGIADILEREMEAL